jgi:3-oxoadipate enol-lactonase
MQTTTGHLETNGGRLYYEVAGAGTPLLLLHAGICDSRMWDDQWEAFAARHRVIRLDLRGFGRTTTDDVSFSNRQDLVDLLDHLGLERAAVVGVSRGGQIAIDLTLAYPERVAALITVCAGVSGYAPDEALIDPRELALFEQMEAAEQAEDWPLVASIDVRLWVDGPLAEEGRAAASVRERVYAMSLNNYQTVTVFGKAQPLEPPAAGRLGEISAPTLVIIGDLDTSSTQQMADALAAGIAGAQKAVMSGTAHLPSMERPEEFSRLVLDFLAQKGL